jgi:hypothetical protein
MGQETSNNPILWRVDKRGVAYVTLNRPQVYNAYARGSDRCDSGGAAVFSFIASLSGTRTARGSWPDERATQIRGAYEAAREICDRRLAADRRCLNSISAKLLV